MLKRKYKTCHELVLVQKNFTKGIFANQIEKNKCYFKFHSQYNIIWRRKWQPTPVLSPGESHEQKQLVGYSPLGCKSWT